MNFLVALSPIFRPTVSNTHGRIVVRYSGPQVSKDVQCDHTAVLISSENNVAMVRVCNRIVIPHSKNFSDCTLNVSGGSLSSLMQNNLKIKIKKSAHGTLFFQ